MRILTGSARREELVLPNCAARITIGTQSVGHPSRGRKPTILASWSEGPKQRRVMRLIWPTARPTRSYLIWSPGSFERPAKVVANLAGRKTKITFALERQTGRPKKQQGNKGRITGALSFAWRRWPSHRSGVVGGRLAHLDLIESVVVVSASQWEKE